MRRGFRVWLANPHRRLTCETCETFDIDQDGTLRRSETTGIPSPRVSKLTPCLFCAKVPAWAKQACDVAHARAHADELSADHRKALAHYNRCKAVGRFPDDPVVGWYAGVFRELEDELSVIRSAQPAETVDRLVEVVLVSLRMRVR